MWTVRKELNDHSEDHSLSFSQNFPTFESERPATQNELMFFRCLMKLASTYCNSLLNC